MTVMRSDWQMKRALRVIAVCFLLLSFMPAVPAQKKKKTQPSKPRVDEIATLRDEFVKLTKEYKTSLEKLLVTYERDVKKAEARLVQSKELFNEGLIAKTDLEKSENAVKVATERVTKTRADMASAEQQIAGTLMEAQVDAQIAKQALRKGMLVTTTAYIRYNGPTNWVLPDAWKVQRFFQDTFKKPLPIAVLGQGAIHDRWRLDHRNAMDISLHPDTVEGQALINFLRYNGIPFLAFRSAIPGTATGPHIHVGRPSHRY
jgi:hypothetical protein